MLQMGEAIRCKMQTGAGYSAWTNSLNKRNQAVVDRFFIKILHDNPNPYMYGEERFYRCDSNRVV